jgi:asparagine synthase (glutamine-hydrolysing)
MCGIYGIVALREGALPDPTVLHRMAGVTVHRGPDDEGQYADPGILLGMRRLSILDVEGGHQPIGNEDGTLQVVCNGEIYNFRELTRELQQAGHRFSTRSDTEVLVHLYEEYGDDFVGRLNGMFGFALWDGRRKRLLVGRDRLGIKPLYYREDGSRLAFASEAKAILALPGVSAELDPAGLEEYLGLGYVPGPRSMFRGIRKLLPGSLLACENGSVTVRRFWSVAAASPVREIPEEEWTGAFLETVERAVVSQMVSDVPLGAFLSGGIDSSTIVAFMARNSSQPVKTYSIGFEDTMGGGYYNELPWARMVAQRYRTDHREIIVKPDVVRLLPPLIWHMDEPMADTAFLTTYLVAKFARQDVTVILSGVGGDELFGGYHRYLGDYYGRYWGFLPGWFRRGLLQPLARALPSDRHSSLMNLSRRIRRYLASVDLPLEERYRSYVEVFGPEGVGEVLSAPSKSPHAALARAFEQVGDGDPLSRISKVDLLTQLPDDLLQLTDRMTMATSLECRVPLLDDTMVDLSLGMPSNLKIRGRELKYVLKKALRDLLPPEILHRKKRGFGAPVGAWLKAELAPLLKRILSSEQVRRRGVFRPEAVEKTIALHEASREDHTDHLLALMNFEIWCRIFLDGRSPDDVSEELAGSEAG